MTTEEQTDVDTTDNELTDNDEEESHNNSETDEEFKEEEEEEPVRKKKVKKDKIVDGSFMGDTKILAALYRQLLEVQNKYGCAINMPQFAFIGVQSSGKSSALSQMLNMPSGVVQDGTGTRCPIRFTLKQDDSISERRIYVNQKYVKNYIYMTKEVCEYTKNLGEKFDDTILEVEISGPNIPNFVIVDLPGIMKKKKSKDAQVLQRMTKRFLTEKLPNNAGFAYIPVFIRAAVDIENDSDPEEIDWLCRKIRPNWKKEAIVVINKIDMSWNRNSEDLANYMNALIKDNPENSVICMCNPSLKRIDTNQEKVKEIEKYIRKIPEIEKEKWEKKLNELGDGRRLKNLVKNYCFVTRLKTLMRDRSIDIVKQSIGPVKAKLEQVERKFISDIQKKETQLHDCKASNLRQEKSRFDDEFLKLHLAFYKGEYGHEVSKYGLTWEEEMKEFFSLRHEIESQEDVDDQDWVKNYYLSPQQLLDALLKDKRQPKNSRHSSFRLKRSMEARLMGTAAIYRALELWRAMISFMSLSKYTIEQVLNTMDFFHHHLYFNVEDTVQKLLLKASENLKNGCVWLGNYINWKLQWDAEKLFITLSNRKISGEKLENMQKIYDFTIKEYKKYVKSIVEDFIKTAKIEPRDLCAIFDSIGVHHFVNLGKLVNEDFKKLHKVNEKGTTETDEMVRIYKKEIEEMHTSRHKMRNLMDDVFIDEEIEEINNNDNDGEDEDSSEEPANDDLKENQNEDEDDDVDKKLKDEKESQLEEQENHNRDKDTEFFFRVYGAPKQMFNKRDNVDFIRHTAAVHWKYIKFHVIKTIQEKFSHRIMYHIKQRSTDLSYALREGVEKPKLDLLVKTLALKAGIAIDLLDKHVEDLIKKGEEKVGNSTRTVTFGGLSDEQLEKTYGVDTESLRKQIEKSRSDLGNFKKSKEEINQNLYRIENSGNFDDDMILMD